jgi:hypothetical protein
MKTRKGIPALALTSLLAAAPAHAEWSVNAQVERFRWTEQVSGPEVVESGGRAGIGLSWTDDAQRGLIMRYRGTLYAGSVRYRGQLQFSGTPSQATTDYAGIRNELQGLYRAEADSVLGLVGGIGLDYWQRSLSFTSQREDWAVLYARAGIETGRWHGLFAGAGVKFPLKTLEDAHFTDAGFDRNPELRPGRELSLYADLGYRMSRRWQLTAYYDSYRFAQSPVVMLTSGTSAFTAWQPRSTMDVVGLRLDYFF